MPEETKHLSKEDLFLLMESYRNMTTMHSTLVEQQKQLMAYQSNMIQKQDDISSQQNAICNKLTRVTEKLEECIKILVKNNEAVSSKCNDIESNVNAVAKELSGQHAGLNSKIYTSMGLMATIVIGLITMIYNLIDKYHVLNDMHITVTQIANAILK